jgi:hypothetical protein
MTTPTDKESGLVNILVGPAIEEFCGDFWILEEIQTGLDDGSSKPLTNWKLSNQTRLRTSRETSSYDLILSLVPGNLTLFTNTISFRPSE